jgi:hypothetical protein
VDETSPAIKPEQLAQAKNETLTVAAGEFTAKRIDIDRKEKGSNIKGKSWFSPDVPGGTVKMEMTIDDGKSSSRINSELSAIERK